MKSAPPTPRSPSRESLRAISYADTIAAEPPIPITAATPPSDSKHKGVVCPSRPKTSIQRLSPQNARSKAQDVRRDSGLAPSSSTARDSRTTLGTDVDSSISIKRTPSIPSSSANDEAATSLRPKTPGDEGLATTKEKDELAPIPQIPFMGILTEIPTGSFEDLTVPGKVEFSKRGSMLIGGKKANNANGEILRNRRAVSSRTDANGSLLPPEPSVPTKVLSADDEALSHKVRSMYEGRGDRDTDWAAELKANMGYCRIEEETTSTNQASHPPSHPGPISQVITNGHDTYRVPSQAPTSTSKRSSFLAREANELAGGIEDWENLSGGDVDRYGFIVPRKFKSQASSLNSSQFNPPEPPRIQRMSTLLQLASETPRRQRSAIRRKKSPSAKSPARSAETPLTSRPASGVVRPASSQNSYRTINGSHSRIRAATNRLPHNKDRRCIDEAGDMLTLPPGLADIAENEEDSKAADDLKRREWEREEKWRKMAKIVKNDRNGGGMVFDFDTKSPKVIERTWKGIPDRWRATAWHAFLTASAKKKRGSQTDDELIIVFQKLVDQGSSDDVQIDIDVPRTISSHVMFRRRYRGGQRLLFRVLHCLSIYFPDTGYVQGMAALAATLLCYFDEETTFVMLVRIFQLRGLERLYQSGFEGLMQALEEFENEWLGKGEVAAKLVSYGVCHLVRSH